MARHLGREKDSNAELVVVSMLIPNQTTHALVVYPDKLGATLRREVMATVGNAEAQRAENLADVLGRRQFADSQKSLLQALHETKALTRIDIDNVQMTPDGNHRLALRTVLEAIGSLASPTDTKFNPHNYNTVVEGQQEQLGVARNLLVEAEMLEADAHNKRAKAYSLAPSLRPAAAVTAPVTEAAPVEAAAETAPEEPQSATDAE